MAFYEKHHPGWVPWLRWYLKIRSRLPDKRSSHDIEPAGDQFSWSVPFVRPTCPYAVKGVPVRFSSRIARRRSLPMK